MARCFLYLVLWRTVVTFVIEKPSGVKIKINPSTQTVNVSWKIPPGDRIQHTFVSLKERKENNPLQYQYVEKPSTNCLIHLESCGEYFLELIFTNGSRRLSNFTHHRFVMTDSKITYKVGTTATISFRSLVDTSYIVRSPAGETIYEVLTFGLMTPRLRDFSKYELVEKGTNSINFIVKNVSQLDAGLYTASLGFTGKRVGCTFVTVTDKPKTPVLSMRPKHAFVGNNISLTCKSSVQRWPEYLPSSLSYTYTGMNGIKDSDKIVIKELYREQKGVNISCTVRDDLGLKSLPSNVITLDPYYGPDSLKIEPYKKKVNITEGDRLGPFTCTADCNPQCVIKWNNKTDEGLGTQSHKSILSIKNIKRINSGTYYCNAVHTKDITRYKEKDMVVNVHYGPDEVNIQPYFPIINIIEDDQLGPFNCSADCNPPCYIQWRVNTTGPFIKITSGSILQIFKIKRYQSGIFQCKVNKKFGGEKIKNIVVNVQYPATITEVRLNKTLWSEGDTYTLYESKNLEISVIIDANPEPSIYFYKTRTRGTIVSYTKSGSIYTFYKNGLRCEDSGKYIIDISNGVKGRAYVRINLDVRCRPRNISFANDIFQTDFGYGKNITLFMVANPMPDIEWTRRIFHDWSIEETGKNYIHKGFTMVINTGHVGIYNVTICNEMGCVDEHVPLKTEDICKCTSAQKESSASVIITVLSTVVVILFLSNVLCVCRFLKEKDWELEKYHSVNSRKTEKKGVCRTDIGEADTRQRVYYNIQGSNQGEGGGRGRNSSRYEEILNLSQPHVYDSIVETM